MRHPWLQKLVSQTEPRVLSKNPRRILLALEGLEERTVPAIITVLNANDSGAGSLRDAVVQAQGNAEPDVILFEPSFFSTQRTINLTSGQLTLDSSFQTTIRGPGANLLSINANNASRVFLVDVGGVADLSGLTITGGNALQGGGVHSRNVLTMTNCEISGNTATDSGGGIWLQHGGLATAKLINCTISGNTAGNAGGGLLSYSGNASMFNCTISGNTAGNAGGGLRIGGDVTLDSCTVSDNSTFGNGANDGGGGLWNNGTTTLFNTIIAGNNPANGNTNGPDVKSIAGAIISQGHNLIGKKDGVTSWNASDLTGTIASPLDPMLDALTTIYGGKTRTMPLRTGSPALNAGTQAPGISEVQTISLVGSPSNFTLTFGGQTTSLIPASASALDVQNALNALASIGGVGGIVSVTQESSSGSGLSYTVTFGGSYAGQNVPAITGLYGTGTLTISTLIEGGSDQRGYQRTVNSDIGAFEANKVINTNDSGPGSLRGAVSLANSWPYEDRIVFTSLFNSTNVITLTSGPLTLADSYKTTISGPDPSLLTISANKAGSVFENLLGADSRLTNLTISGGAGGGVNNYGYLTISNSSIRDNIGGGLNNYESGNLSFNFGSIVGNSGSGINNKGSTNPLVNNWIYLYGVDISGNSGVKGGGFATEGNTQTILTACTISGNIATGIGGGISVSGPQFSQTFHLNGCTISGNRSGGDGGGFDASIGVKITHSTISGNISSGKGGGVHLSNLGSTSILDQVTISANSANQGGGLEAVSGTVSVANTILAGNTSRFSGPDVLGTVGSQGFNLVGIVDGSSGWLGYDLQGTITSPLDPLLASLADNGGLTQTMALLPHSPAINRGNPANSGTLDQRWETRFANTDIGAFEYRFKVTNTLDDSNPGSLRAAITMANNVPGADTIVFRIGYGVQTISPLTPLPDITQTVTIDATTQPGYAGTPLIELDGTNVFEVIDGPPGSVALTNSLVVKTDNSVIQGLAINRWNFAGIILNGNSNKVQGNYIGLAPDGVTARPNSYGGVWIYEGDQNVIGVDGDGVNDTAERNVISGNNTTGVYLQGATVNNTIAGNIIGLNATGTAVAGPQQFGIWMYDDSVDGTRIGTNGDGVSDALERNVISGNTALGIRIDGGDNSVIAGNLIGTNGTGTSLVYSAQSGVSLGPGTTGTRVGTDANGISDVLERNVIVGATGNLTGNNYGVLISGNNSSDNTIAGNNIGVGINGGPAMPNQVGVLVHLGAHDNLIGGAAPGADNWISGNLGAGIQIDGPSTVGNTLRQNRVYGNGGQEIWLLNGGNRDQKPPVLTGVLGGDSTRVLGNLTDGAPNTSYLIELFSGNTPDEARLSLGTGVFTTNAMGMASFDITVAGVVPFGTQVNATATRLDTGDTSGLVAGMPTAGAIVSGIPVSLVEGTPVTLTAFTAADPGGGQSLAFNWTVTKNGNPFATSAEASITFTPDNQGTYSVTLLVTNSNGTSAQVGPFSIDAVNGPPAPQIFGAPSIAPAGVPIHLHGLGNDPGTADVVTYSWQVRDTNQSGKILFAGNGPDFDFTPLNGGLYFVSLTADDQDGGVGNTSQVIVASGGAALATISAPLFADEGTPVRALAALADLIQGDALTYQWSVRKAGVPYPFSLLDAGGITFTPDDNALYSIGLTVVSGGMSYLAPPALVEVRNVKPQPEILSAPTITPLGIPVTIQGGAKDRGSADSLAFQWSVVGPFPIAGGTGQSFTFVPTAPGDYVLKLTARDDDGGFSTVAKAIRVTGSGLTVQILGGTPSIQEGTPIPLTSLIPNANGSSLRYDWVVTRDGDPYLTQSSASPSNPGGFTNTPYPLTLIPADNGNYAVTLTVTANDGRIGSATVTMAVTNLPPAVAIIGGDGVLSEGGLVPLTAVVTDPGAADTLSYQWSVNGVPQQPDQANHKILNFIPPDNGSYTVSLTVTDKDGASSTATRDFTVQNVAPKVTISSDSATTSSNGALVGLTSLVTDPGQLDTFTYAWTTTLNGTVVATGSAPQFVFSRSGAGTYVTSLLVTDKDGGVAVASTLNLVASPGGGTILVTPATLAGLPGNLALTQILVQGLGGNDNLIVDPAVTIPVVLDGGAGNDLLQGGSADDILIAGPGNNTLIGGSGNDLLRGGGNDNMSGGFGDDYYFVHFSTVALFETGSGSDTIDLTESPEGITFNLSTQDGTPQPVFTGSTLAITGPFEKLIGSNFGDDLSTSTSGTNLFGGLGEDSLTVAGGIDVTVFGGEGIDSLVVSGGSEVTVFGGAGEDSVAVLGGSDITVFGDSGADSISVEGGLNVTVFGGEGGDTLSVGPLADLVTVFGGDGMDSIQVDGGSGILILGGNGLASGSNVTVFGSLGEDGDSISVAGGVQVTVFGSTGDDSLLVGSGASEVTVFGGLGQDSIGIQSASEVTVFGEAGNDSISVGGTANLVTIFGGIGEDSIAVQSGSEVTVYGGDGNDSLTIGALANQVTVFGGTGDDTLAIGGGTQITVFGEAGNDSIAVTGGLEVTIFGGLGEDSLGVSGGEQVTVFGEAGNDSIAVEGGTLVTVFGSEGNDSIAVSGGLEITVFGGLGEDSLGVSGGDQVTVFGDEGDDSITVAGGTRITVFGGTGNDSVGVGGGLNVTVFGSEGNDSLWVGGGDKVTVFGGEGNDSLVVGGGTEVTVFGEAGDDSLAVTEGTQVTVFGGEGNDSISVGGPSTQVTVFGGIGEDTLSVTGGTEVTVFGEEGNDSILVSGGTQVTVFGSAGEDTIGVIGGEQVTVFGGTGNDSIEVGGGDQVTVFGSDGNDSILVSGGTQVTVFGSAGVDTIGVGGGDQVTVFGGLGDDLLSVSGGTHVTVFGSEGNDSVLVGGGDQVTVFGDLGDDVLSVSGGTHVTVFGSEGNDSVLVGGGDQVTVFGNAGEDTVSVLNGLEVTVFGGLGDDLVSVSGGTQVTVFGDAGNDSIIAGGGDQITVFGSEGNDTLSVSGGEQVTVFGGFGEDILVTSGGVGVRLYGEANDDFLSVSGGLNVTVSGGSGNDTLSVTGGTGVILLGNSGEDLLQAIGAYEATLSAGTGDDQLFANQSYGTYLFGDDGNDAYAFGAQGLQLVRLKEILVLDVAGYLGGEEGDVYKENHLHARGSDTINLSAFGSASLNLSVYGSEADYLQGAQSVAWGFTLTLFGQFENIVGTSGNDQLIGNDTANQLIGGEGDDWIEAGEGDDTIEGGAGGDTILGGTGNDTYVFAGENLGSDLLVEDAEADSDTLDFSGLFSAITLDLSNKGIQEVGNGLTLELGDETAFENVVGTDYSDSITGNARDNSLEGRLGGDILAGASGNDTYVFVGAGLGADHLVEAPGIDADTLDFSQFDEPLNLDLAWTGYQAFLESGETLTFSDALGFENVIGTAYPDVIRGNSRDNVLVGAGGSDLLEGGAGNDTLQADFTQVVYLDFESATREDSSSHVYMAGEQALILERLQVLFAPFNYRFTTSREEAMTLTSLPGYRFNTLVMNGGAGGLIGGEANELDFGNRIHGTWATVNINNLLGGEGQPPRTSENIIGLTATISAHELGHLAGLLHTDALGPIGSGLYSGLSPSRFLPEYGGPSEAWETPRRIMASPLSVGTSLADAAGLTSFGEREAIKLAFNETGVVRREKAVNPGSHGTFATAEALGVLPGLAVPNTLLPGDLHYGKAFDVSAVSVVGNIRLVEGRSENDVYSFLGKAGDLMNLSVVSAALIPSRGNPIDGILKLYGSDGQLLAINDDGPESLDPVILDYSLPADGVYYVVVDTYSSTFDLDVGRYELFINRFAITSDAPAINLGDTLIGGAGSDVLWGSAANDVYRATGSEEKDRDSYYGKSGFDSLDITGYPLVEYSADSVELIIGQDQAPTIQPPAPLHVLQGALVSMQVTAFDPDFVDRMTFSLSESDQPGGWFPDGASVDPANGMFTWAPVKPGVYTVVLTVTDAAGLSDSAPWTITVAHVAPSVTVGSDISLKEGETLLRNGFFLDPGADSWSAMVDYGDGAGYQSLALTPDKSFTLDHHYEDDGVYTVSVVVADDYGTSIPASFAVTVANVAPQGSLSSTGKVMEGGFGVVSFSGLQDDSPADLAAGLGFSFALSPDSLADIYADSSTQSSASFYFPSSGFHKVYGRIFDKDGGYRDYDFLLEVENVAPVANAMANPGLVVHAGSLLNLQGGFVDPGQDVPASGLVWTVISGNGQIVPAATGPTLAFTPEGAGTYTAMFKVTDADGAVSVAQLEITVVNPVPPAGILTNSGLVIEGGSAFVTMATANVAADRKQDLRYAFDFDNDGTFELGDGTYSGSVMDSVALVPTSFLANGPFDRVVRARVIDPDGRFTDATTSISVLNAVPAVTAGGPVQLSESSPAISRTGTFSDPGNDIWFASVDYGDGTGKQALVLNPDKSFTLHHEYGDSGNYKVTVWVTDSDGAVGSASFMVAVVNQAPVGVLNNGGDVDEASSALVSLGSLSDPSQVDSSAGLRFSYDLDNDGVFEIGSGTYAGSVTDTSVVVPASLLADNQVRTVLARVIDKDGGYNDYTTTFTVRNVAPVASISGPNQVTSGQSAPFTLTASDLSPVDQAAGFSFTIDWGDGSPIQTVNGTSPLAVYHAFLSSGKCIVRVTATDKDGAVGPAGLLEVDTGGQVTLQDGNLLVNGGTGTDIIQVNSSDSQIQIVINGVIIGSFAVTGTVTVIGGVGDDTITINPGVRLPVHLVGGDGNDFLQAGGGSDRLQGGIGNDTLAGGAGDDILEGGQGDDRLDGGSGDDTVYGGEGNDSIVGGKGRDFLDGGANDDFFLGWGGDFTDDLLNGGTGFNRLINPGTGGNLILSSFGPSNNIQQISGTPDQLTQKIHGTNGNDVLDFTFTSLLWIRSVDALAGDDSVTASSLTSGMTYRGGSGNDVMVAGSVMDILEGGGGRDVFRFKPGVGNASHVISDFRKGGNLIDLSALGITRIGSPAIPGSTGWVVAARSGKDTLLTIHLANGGTWTIRLLGFTGTLDRSDFLFA